MHSIKKTKYISIYALSLLLQSYHKCESYSVRHPSYTVPKASSSIYPKTIKFNFEEHIEKLRQRADEQRGITWQVSKDTHTLLRDATNALECSYVFEDYAIQIVNMYRAAHIICTIYNKNEQALSFKADAKKFIQKHLTDKNKLGSEHTEDYWQKASEETAADVVKKLKTIFSEDGKSICEQDLRIAENYVGLDDPHYDITTKFKVEDRIFGLEDKKWLTLTDKQKEAFEQRKELAWYKNLSELEQKLLEHYLDKFLDNNHYFPTQIRNLPGCRNAYKKRVIAYDHNNNEETLGVYGHLAALTALGQKNAEVGREFCQENWNQICNNSASAEDIRFLCLNHQQEVRGIYEGETRIVQETKEAVGEEGFTNFPINHMGRLNAPTVKRPTQILAEKTQSVFKNTYPAICQALEAENLTPKRAQQLQEQIDSITDRQDRAYFQHFIALKKISACSDIRNIVAHNMDIQNNRYVEASSDYVFCENMINLKTKPDRSDVPLVISCKSGKDRTGYVCFTSDADMIESFLPDEHKETKDQIYSSMAKSAHFQLLAGLNGGMPGRIGIKGTPIKKTNMHNDIHNLLFSKTAKYT